MSMSRPYVRLCADSLPGALRPRSVPAPRRPYTTQLARRSRCHPPRYATSTRNPRLQATPNTLRRHERQFATVGTKEVNTATGGGPLEEYDTRVEQGRLRDDPFQRRKHARYADSGQILITSRNRPESPKPLPRAGIVYAAESRPTDRGIPRSKA